MEALENKLGQAALKQGDVVGQVLALVKNGALTQSEIAKESGVSPTALSRWLIGQYQGDNDKINDALAKWLDARARQTGFLLPEEAGFVETRTAERIIKALGYAQMAPDLAVIYGAAGLGKTRTLRHYGQTRNNVWIATISPATATTAACLGQLCRATGIRGTRGKSAGELRQSIADKIRETRGLLVVDEAQHLSLAALETIRSIHDETEIGLALCGNEQVYSRLTGNGHGALFAQLFSRIGKRVALSRTHESDVEGIAAAYGVTETKAVAELQRIARAPGALRGVVKALRLAAMLATGDRQELAVAHINAAWKELGGVQ
jgi:hypothetical protein